MGSSTPAIYQDEETKPSDAVTEKKATEASLSHTRVPSRYFIVKSLSVDDLEISRQNSIWATQTHNEKQLNEAYEVSSVPPPDKSCRQGRILDR